MKAAAGWILLFAMAALTEDSAWAQGNVRPDPAGQTRPPAAQLRPPSGQPGNAGPGNERPQAQRPAPRDLVIEKLPADLEQLLDEWEQKTTRIKTLHGHHHRWSYESTFCVEKRSFGEFYYEAPDRGRIDMKGIEPSSREVSKKVDAQGVPYKIVKPSSERYVCTGEEVVKIDDDIKEFDVFPLPKELRGVGIVNSPLPFLFGMKAEDTKRRFQLTLLSNTPNEARLKAVPRLEMDYANYQEALIILDKQNFLPTAVKLIHRNKKPDVNKTSEELGEKDETVYSFSKFTINNAGLMAKIKDTFGSDPFRPSIPRDYRRMVSANAEAPPGSKSPQPPIRDNQVAPSAGTRDPSGRPLSPTGGVQPNSGNRPPSNSAQAPGKASPR